MTVLTTICRHLLCSAYMGKWCDYISCESLFNNTLLYYTWVPLTYRLHTLPEVMTLNGIQSDRQARHPDLGDLLKTVYPTATVPVVPCSLPESVSVSLSSWFNSTAGGHRQKWKLKDVLFFVSCLMLTAPVHLCDMQCVHAFRFLQFGKINFCRAVNRLVPCDQQSCDLYDMCWCVTCHFTEMEKGISKITKTLLCLLSLLLQCFY